MNLIHYTESYKNVWDRLIGESRNGTFLFERDYMDYHKARFKDCSLMFFEKDKLLGVFPANICDRTVFSHDGLTYGGLIVGKRVYYNRIAEMLDLLCDYYRQHDNAQLLVYKPIPHIYHKEPMEEDLYWLFCHGAKLVRRKLSSALMVDNGASDWSKLRLRRVRRAMQAGIQLSKSEDEQEWADYWRILTEVLETRHQCQPVHTLQEILGLHKKFKDAIQLMVAKLDGKVIAGFVVYRTPKVKHYQYIAANEIGREYGALDYLFHEDQNVTPHSMYIDFGVSTEEDGKYLNEGLIFQKQGMAGRGICYDEYELNL